MKSLSFIGSTLSICLQDGSNCRQRSLLCLRARLFRNSFHRTESSHHGPKLYTWKERRFVSEEHPKVSNGNANRVSKQQHLLIPITVASILKTLWLDCLVVCRWCFVDGGVVFCAIFQQLDVGYLWESKIESAYICLVRENQFNFKRVTTAPQ